MGRAVPPLAQDRVFENEMAAAHEFFDQTARQLGSSYQFLEGKVAQLTRELDTVSAEKAQELETKKRLANRMRTLLDFLPGGVIVLDARGVIAQSNPAAQQMLNHPLDGARWRDLISSCFAPRNDDGLEISTVEGRRISFATASLEDEGQIILLTDQTETRRLQQQVSRYEKLSAVGRMVSALAHQIRTPLSAALLYAGHLCNGQVQGAQRDLFAQKLLGRLNHMERQVRDMLLFVRNELPLNELVTLADLCDGLQAAMEVPLSSNGAVCDLQNPNPKLLVRCNREALISALLNLVNNAVQACSQDARLKISLSKTALHGKSAIAIAVADNGPGMTEEQQARALEVFYSTKPQGTGLGLAVVQSVARAHGGEFHLQSQPGRGTCATLTLPTAESERGN